MRDIEPRFNKGDLLSEVTCGIGGTQYSFCKVQRCLKQYFEDDMGRKWDYSGHRRGNHFSMSRMAHRPPEHLSQAREDARRNKAVMTIRDVRRWQDLPVETLVQIADLIKPGAKDA